jgi:hypothetical protein
VKEWREYYVKEKKDNPDKNKKKKVKKKFVEKLDKVNDSDKQNDKSREEVRNEKYKKIMKMRGKPEFNDLEKELKKIDSIDYKKIRLCSDTTCGNKVMCFEYEGKIWKEGRKSMNYNRDYCVLDNCKEIFGLEKIGMERVITNFRIEKNDKSKKSWNNNWHVKYIEKNEEPVVYCVMNKIKPGIEIGKIKREMINDKKLLKEFVKIGVFRGIFRVSDFNGRNVLLKDKDKLVSIDEGDIGKRLDILGGREKWLIKELNKDKKIISEILEECFGTDKMKGYVIDKMKEYKFSDMLCEEIINNWGKLKKDLEEEGIEFNNI